MDENIISHFPCIGGKMSTIWTNGDVTLSWRGTEKHDVIINGATCYQNQKNAKHAAHGEI